ncbi:MAG: glucokinase [Pseudomonadota bacterium]
MADPANARSIVADIGGTNTRVALAAGGQLLPGSARRYRNAEFDALEPVLRRFMEESGTARAEAACLAMAGPVHDGKGSLTNLDWTLDTHVLADATGAGTVALLNDLQAQGYALGHLPAKALQAIIPGPPPNLRAAQLVVGLGTGFNAAPVFNTAAGRLVPPSEAGHASLPARTEDALALSRFITARHGFCSVEDALSGRGLASIYAYLADRDGVAGGLDSGRIMALCNADDAGPEADRAREALRMFVRLAGEVCGDLALTLLPFGGVFLIGGMARAVAPHTGAMGFTEAFRDKGRFGPFMERFTVTLVSDDDAALMGSAMHLHTLLAQG